MFTKGMDPLDDPKDGQLLMKSIIDTIREPLVVLDDKLRILAASNSFYTKFNVSPEETYHKLFYDFGNGQWNIPTLRALIEKVISENTPVIAFEVERTFVGLGQRTMLIDVHGIRSTTTENKLLLSISDITEQRTLDRDRERLMKQKDTLLREMRHRIANSLQLIASIILLKAGSVKSEESRLHLEDAHERILSIATVQRNLDPTGESTEVPVVLYLTALCDSLAKSMIGDRKPITLTVKGDEGTVKPDEAISLGLITTELVINSLKHAFPNNKGGVTIAYEASMPPAWKLIITDNGIGMRSTEIADHGGLGTSILESLAAQLDAGIKRESSLHGTIITIFHPRKST